MTNLLRQNWTEDSLRIGDRVTASGDLGRERREEAADSRGRYGRWPRGAAARRSGETRAIRSKRPPTSTTATTKDAPSVPIDITGPWRNDYKWHVTVDDLEPKPTPFTAEGRRIFEATQPWHDYALRCMAMGLPRIFGAPYNMDIVDAGSHYLMVYVEHNTPRRVWMDGRSAPADTPATPMGFSVGRWEGETLDHRNDASIARLARRLRLADVGRRHANRRALRVSADRLSIDRTMAMTDPLYTQPLVRRRSSARGEDVSVTEQAPCDPASYYRDLDASGRLEEHFSR